MLLHGMSVLTVESSAVPLRSSFLRGGAVRVLTRNEIVTAQSDPYVRVYYRIIDDPKFEGVYDHDAALAAWLRLLLAADAMYPAPATLPRSVKPAALKRLTDAGLVDLLPGDRFRLHGLRGERERRQDQARKAARKRWDHASADTDAMPEQSVSNAGASGNGMHSKPSQAAPIRTEPSQAEPTLLAGELPDENDSATLACRQLFDSGKWLGDREYVTAWEDMDRRYSPEWVKDEIPNAFAACLERRGKVLPWDLKRMTEQRLAERSRAEERHREAEEARRLEEAQAARQAAAVALSEEERERQSLIRRAVRVWTDRGMKGPKVPEQVDELREWLDQYGPEGAGA